MSTLTLVRHGQAAPFHGRAAELTALGETQAARLAEYWLRHGVEFTEAHTGGLPRQVRTGRIVADAYGAAGKAWPEMAVDPSWNEYDAPGVLKDLAPADDVRQFQRMFEQAMQCWLEGRQAADDVEPWTAFRDRVTGAVRRILDGPSGRRVVVFTSGGPIGLAVQHAVRAPDRSFLELNWRVRNLSVTEFIFDRDRFNLDSFNNIPHLDDAGLRTWR